MLERAREDFLLAKLREMLRQERQKLPHDSETIAAIKRVILQLQKQLRERPKAKSWHRR